MNKKADQTEIVHDLFSNLSDVFVKLSSTVQDSLNKAVQEKEAKEEEVKIKVDDLPLQKETIVTNTTETDDGDEDEDEDDGIVLPSYPWAVEIEGVNAFTTIAAKFSVFTRNEVLSTIVVELFPDNGQNAQIFSWLREANSKARLCKFSALDENHNAVDYFSAHAFLDAVEFPHFDAKDPKPWTTTIQLSTKEIKFGK
jgi:hypothetical protein